MPPQYNPRLRRLEEYEQMKRKNRRRLVGALLMAGIAALLLAKVLGGSENIDAPGSITVSDEGAPVSAPAVQVASAPADEGALPPAETAVLPADPAEQEAGKQTRVTVLPNPLTGQTSPAAPEVKPAPREAAKPADALPAKTPASAPHAESPTPRAKAEPAKPAVPPTAKPAENRSQAPQPAGKESRPPAAKPAGERERRQPVEAPARRPPPSAATGSGRGAQQKGNQAGLSPEEILNNRAARQAARPPSSPQEILNGRSEPRRTVIQVGAYTSAEQANAVQKRLADAGVSAYVAPSESNGNRLYRVRTGSYPSAEAANQALSKIKAQGLDGMLLER